VKHAPRWQHMPDPQQCPLQQTPDLHWLPVVQPWPAPPRFVVATRPTSAAYAWTKPRAAKVPAAVLAAMSLKK
jgi:hypothetical protein